MSETLRAMQAQTEVMTQLPATLGDLQRAVRGVADALAASKETVASAQQVSERLASVLDEIEEPVRALRPGIVRLGEVLNSPVVERIPAVLEAIEATVLPLAAGAERGRARWAWARSGIGRVGRSVRIGSRAARRT